MSAHPMPSLKSSVASKSSSSFHVGASSFEPSSASRVAAECFVFHQESLCSGRHSSWISRLLSTTADASVDYPYTTASSDNLAGKLAISSTHEPRNSSSSFDKSNSSIFRRYLGFPHAKKPPTKTKVFGGDRDRRLVASFGPFKVRETGKSANRVSGKGVFVGGQEGEGGNGRVLERNMEDEGIGGQISPLAVQFRSRLTRDGAGVLEKGIACVDGASSSRSQSCFGPWKVESRLKAPVFGSFLASGGTGLEAARRRGAAYRDLSHDGSVTRSFQNIHNLHGDVIPQQPGMQVRKIEAEEPFSFWNMGRFKRADFVSSVSPSFDLSWNLERKRKPNAEVISSSKDRRM